jgi:hypothetical protein
VAGGAPATRAQSGPAASSPSDNRSRPPFSVGEALVYTVKFGGVSVGKAHMGVAGVEDIRGRPCFHLVFTIDGGIPLARVHDRYESWIDTLTLASRRYVEEIREVRYHRHTRYEIFPEERKYRKNDEDSLRTSVENPLDEGSFLYFIRTVRVSVGQTREFDQYFMPDRNPVIIRAIRRDTVEVPSGRYPAVVVRPTIRTKGLFAEDGQAELWFSDDARRLLLQLKAKFAGLSLSLYLAEVHLGE